MAKPRPSRISERMPASAMPSEGSWNVAGEISASGVPSALNARTAASSSASSAALKLRIQSVCGCRSRPYQTPGPETGPGGMLGFTIHRRIPEWGMKPWLALIVLLGIFTNASAQYPSKPISLVIPFGAGGDSDLSGRLLAQYAAKYLGNATFIPLNRVGASGSIGTMQVRTAAP